VIFIPEFDDARIDLEKKVKTKLKTVEFNKSRFKTYFGNIGEMIASEILLKEGFRVWGLKPYEAGGSRQNRYLYIDDLYVCLSFYYKSNVTYREGDLGVEKTRELAIKELENFFGEKLVAFKKYMESIGVIGKTGIVGASRIKMVEPTAKHVYTPDLVCRKDNNIYIVEVKTNSGNIYNKPERVKGLLLARKFGLIPLLIHMNVRIDASDFSIQELS
jgi:hypothetical protein